MESILQSIQRALRAHDMAPTRFGRLAVGDPRFVGELQRGREMRRTTEAAVIAFLASLGEQATQDKPAARDARSVHRESGGAGCLIRHRIAMREGSAALLAAILSARGEAQS